MYVIYFVNKEKYYLQNLSKETMIPDDQNNMLKAIDVFALSLKFIKDNLDKELEKTGYDIGEEEVQWVITIPAIWNPRSKQFMRIAAEKVLYSRIR